MAAVARAQTEALGKLTNPPAPALPQDPTRTSSEVGVAPAVLSVLASSPGPASPRGGFSKKAAQVGESPEVPPLPARNQGNQSWRNKQGFREGPAKLGAQTPWPNSFHERFLNAKVSGNRVWGSRRPEFRVHPHRQLWPHGVCSLPPSLWRPLPAGHPHAPGGDDCGRACPAPRTSRCCPRAHASWGRRPPSAAALGCSLPGYTIPIGRRLPGQPITGGGALWRDVKSRGT